MTADAATNEAEASIIDLEGLFKYSGLVDGLRDGAKVLLRFSDPSRDTLKQMANQYTQLRTALQEVVRDDIAEETSKWAYDIDPETVTIDGIYMAASGLARWMDLVHQTPNFILSQQVQAANQRQVQKQIQEEGGGAPGAPLPPGLVETPKAQVGQYL